VSSRRLALRCTVGCRSSAWRTNRDGAPSSVHDAGCHRLFSPREPPCHLSRLTISQSERSRIMANESVLVFWAGDPLQGVVTLGSAGLIMWSPGAALVGSVLGMLRALESPDRRQEPAPRRPRPGARLRPLSPQAAGALSSCPR